MAYQLRQINHQCLEASGRSTEHEDHAGFRSRWHHTEFTTTTRGYNSEYSHIRSHRR